MNRPIIHLNGDSAVRLVRQHREVQKAAIALLEAMGRACPHGRNYPFADTYSPARAEWEALRTNVLAVRDWGGTIMEDLLRQCDDRPGGRYAVALEVMKTETVD